MKDSAPSGLRFADESPALLYLRLLKRCLVRDLFPDQRFEFGDVERPVPYSMELRKDGRDWPTEAVTMVGMKRLDNLQECCLAAVRDSVPGDFVETGIWRGGCGILMRAVLEACNDEHRKVWLFDSFEGLPRPDSTSFPKDKDDPHWTLASYLGVGLDQVKDNFRRYELLDERTRFVQGWFRDTIPSSEVEAISVLRLDGDMYESTWVVLTHLYPKLSAGGFVIIDDYGAIPACKAAVDDYRGQHSIQSPVIGVDWTGVFWRK
jgi:O-methyltransferase